jgi:methionyl aminopeptidase
LCKLADDSQPLLEGCIINLDIALYVPYGPEKLCYHGDTSTTVPAGEMENLSTQSRNLLAATKEALKAGIDACGPWKPYNGIGKAISAVASKHNFTVVPELSGHGIGREYHQHPLILHVHNDDPGEMAPGTIFTIEPCLSEGNGQYTVDPDDGWSLYSVDGSRAAQEEHTVMITETGVDVLTKLR